MCFRPPDVNLSKVCEACGTENGMIVDVCANCGKELPDVAMDIPAMPSISGAPGAPAAPGSQGVTKAPGFAAVPGAPKMPGAPGAPKPPGN